MHSIRSLIERISQGSEINLRIPRLLMSIFVLVILFALFDISIFMRGTDAAFVDQVASTIAEFFAGTWGTENCTLSQGYWKEHPDAWPVEEITLGGVTYPKSEALELINDASKGDATYILAPQLIAAKLNILHGADPAEIKQSVDEADSWLVDHPLGSNPQKPARDEGIRLAQVLDLYNVGAIGPGSCSEESSKIIVLSIEETVEVIQPDPPQGSPSPTPKDDGGSETVGTETPLPTSTIAPTDVAPPIPTLTSTGRISPSPTLIPTATPRSTPTPAPTQDPFFTPTVETSRPTPTPAPTMGASPTPLPPTPTTTPTEYSGPPGCTHGMEYWVNHPDDWSLSEFRLGEVSYDQVEALTILATNPQGDATYILAQQVIAARLNIASPADPGDITGILELANTWFVDHPLGSSLNNPERKVGLDLAKALEDYNLGITGPGVCEGDLPTATPTPSSTPEPSLTMTPTFTPSLTMTPIY